MNTIPEKHLEFCRAVAALAADAGINQASLTYHPGIHDEWRDEIRMQWESGRHGEDSRRVYITSNVQVRTELKPPNISN